jgi:hypothetical protein
MTVALIEVSKATHNLGLKVEYNSAWKDENASHNSRIGVVENVNDGKLKRDKNSKKNKRKGRKAVKGGISLEELQAITEQRVNMELEMMGSAMNNISHESFDHGSVSSSDPASDASSDEEYGLSAHAPAFYPNIPHQFNPPLSNYSVEERSGVGRKMDFHFAPASNIVVARNSSVDFKAPGLSIWDDHDAPKTAEFNEEFNLPIFTNPTSGQKIMILATAKNVPSGVYFKFDSYFDF